MEVPLPEELGRQDGETVDSGFFTRRIRRALDLRERFVLSPDTNACRVINGESDGIPGLIVDRYDRHLVVQFHTRGIERWRAEIVEALTGVLDPLGIYERSDSARKGGPEGAGSSGLLMGSVPERVEIRENGIRFLVDLIKGQKTGFFLDQRDKRQALRRYSPDAGVLNCFSYSGAFSVYALAAGAKRVVSVDASEPALELARENVRINGLDEGRCEFVCSDVKEYLRGYASEPYDVIVLDPPAFVKDRKKKVEGIRGYRTVNESALSVLAPGGVLLTCSCSAHVSMQDFRYAISEAGARAGRGLGIIETMGHGIDHPVSVAYTEGEYLKCLVLKAD